MKLAKRLFALALVLCMVFCLSVAVFADGEGETTPTETTDPGTKTYDDMSTVTITKKYTLENEGTSPAETFTVEQFGDGTVKTGDATSAPALGAITGAQFAADGATAAGATQSITITLPEYDKVGVYEYTLKETIPENPTAGVAYREENIKLVVTVIEQNGRVRVAAVHTEGASGEKSGVIENTYTAGNLTISKSVTGNLGDKSKYFKFTVTLTGETGKTNPTSLNVSSTSYTDNPTTINVGTPTDFYLKNDETLTISNLPKGMSYTVKEADYTGNNGGYTTTVNGESGLESSGTMDAQNVTAAFVNNKTGDVDTGVSLDSLPYILALAVAFGGAVVMFTRKRHVED